MEVRIINIFLHFFSNFTIRGPQPLPPQAPVPTFVASFTFGNVSAPFKMASLIVLREILRHVQTFVNLSRIASGT